MHLHLPLHLHFYLCICLLKSTNHASNRHQRYKYRIYGIKKHFPMHLPLHLHFAFVFAF